MSDWEDNDELGSPIDSGEAIDSEAESSSDEGIEGGTIGNGYGYSYPTIERPTVVPVTWNLQTPTQASTISLRQGWMQQFGSALNQQADIGDIPFTPFQPTTTQPQAEPNLFQQTSNFPLAPQPQPIPTFGLTAQPQFGAVSSIAGLANLPFIPQPAPAPIDVATYQQIPPMMPVVIPRAGETQEDVDILEQATKLVIARYPMEKHPETLARCALNKFRYGYTYPSKEKEMQIADILYQMTPQTPTESL